MAVVKFGLFERNKYCNVKTENVTEKNSKVSKHGRNLWASDDIKVENVSHYGSPVYFVILLQIRTFKNHVLVLGPSLIV